MLHPTARVASNGKMTVPRAVREKLGISPGDRLEFVEDHGRFRIRKCVPHSPFDRYVGFLEGSAGQDSDELVRDLRGHE